MSHYSMDAADNALLLDPATFSRELRLYRYVVLAGFVLLIYDHTLTLGTEVKFIWAAKLRPSIYWFLAVRYIGLVANIANCVLFFAELSREVRVPLFSSVQALNDLFSEVCIKMQLMWKLLIVSQDILIQSTLIMRVFAMYGRNWWILICTLAASALCPVFALWDTIKEGQPQIFSGSGISGIVCDMIVFLLTIRCAYFQREIYPTYAGTLLWRMTTDGAMYYGIIIIATAANIGSFYLGDILLAGFLSWFLMSLSITLLARLMLNLHEAAAKGTTSEEPNSIELDTLRFATGGGGA
ncbi:hypothetical protein B0H19DRAFT_1273919 [Mycena capillaripes]|nr:hypothetical protein B0H19DRAFT_1273919 [Mycena capillaripes]